RGRGFFLPMDSMMNILPEHKLLISDVRQNGAGPLGLRARQWCRVVAVEMSGVGAEVGRR
ncbi:hypothetical protein PWY87_25660, partial [Kribbella solani]|uniref:hypothetical protein n=1 Tax=Kribbella solani TaxID=236067 RepID=UPI0029A3C893